MKHPALAIFLAAAALAAATPQQRLRSALEARFLGDRTGITVAAALVGDVPAEAFVSADAARPAKVDAHTAFEIGAVAGTMASALAADRILKGEASLDDALATLLAGEAKVPAFEGTPITLAHVLSHRSGLPSLPARLRPEDALNPFASLTPAQLLGSLEDARLDAAPGTRSRPSSFAMMLLSSGLARRAGMDYEALLARDIFKPLGMEDARIRRTGRNEAQGHASNGRPAGPWDFPPDMAGAGGVRASLADMVRYVEAALGRRASSITPALERTRVPFEGTLPPVAMNWMVVTVAGRKILHAEGATGGFSSFVALDPEKRQGVVLLADTSLSNLGGLVPMGLSLLDDTVPSPGFPRRPVPAGEGLLEGMTGRYTLPGGTRLAIWRKDGGLVAQIEDWPPLDLGFDSAGDFYALDLDAVLRPVRGAAGYTFFLRQGGGQVKAERVQPDRMDAAALQKLVGKYRASDDFTVKVIRRETLLYVQGTDQPEVLVEPVDKDVFQAPGAGAEFTFTRDAAGKVVAVVIKQNGRTVKAEKR